MLSNIFNNSLCFNEKILEGHSNRTHPQAKGNVPRSSQPGVRGRNNAAGAAGLFLS